MKKKIIGVAFSLVGLVAIFAASGCQTAEGFGRDLESLGERIQDRSR